MVDGLSLRELARIAKVSEAYPSLIASGKREKIGGDVAEKLAIALGCTIDFLLRGTEPAPTPSQVLEAVTEARLRKAREQQAKAAEGVEDDDVQVPETETNPAGAKGAA